MECDEVVPKDYPKKMDRLKQQLRRTENVDKTGNFGKINNVCLHSFSDASETVYGKCSYLRLVDLNVQKHCALLLGKAWVTTKKFVSIPRSELV